MEDKSIISHLKSIKDNELRTYILSNVSPATPINYPAYDLAQAIHLGLGLENMTFEERERLADLAKQGKIETK